MLCFIQANKKLLVIISFFMLYTLIRCPVRGFAPDTFIKYRKGTNRARPHPQVKLPRQSSSAFGLNVVFSKATASCFEENMDHLFKNCLRIKCPFMKRRSIEAIESMNRILQFIVARHKSTPFVLFPVTPRTVVKWRNLSLVEIADIIHQDWHGNNLVSESYEVGKGYYITGRLTKQIYAEDCFFDGPDPDMPVRGLRKYLLFASQLFDSKVSRAELTRPLYVDVGRGRVVAYWRLEGVLNLPWHPQVKPWTGHTEYVVNASTGLVEQHLEQWDISTLDAFLSVLLPHALFRGAPSAPSVDPSADTRPTVVNPVHLTATVDT